MPLGANSLYAVVLPVAKTNLLLNSSFERGTLGMAAIQSASLGSAANEQQFGAWSCFVVPNSNGTSGAALGTWTAGNGTDYTVSAYVNGSANVAYMIGVGDSNGLNLVGSSAFTGGGTWQRYNYSYTESTGAVRRVVIRKTSGASVGTFYVDGVQAEVGSITTYIDGDQDGCQWQGAIHASQAARSGTYRGGGSVVALADLGFTVDQALGIGMPPLENTSQSFALTDGAEYQHTRAGARALTLTSRMDGTTQRDYHITRRTVLNALKIDSVAPQQPTRFWYVGAEGTVTVDAVLDTGMEGAQRLENDGFGEHAAPRFIAHDPYWHATTDEGTALATRTVIGSTNFIAYRDALGHWGTMGQSGSAIYDLAGISAGVRAILDPGNGTVFVGGTWGTVAGTAFPNVAMWFPATNTWGTLAGGTVDLMVRDFVQAPSGTLYVAGQFTIAAGTKAPLVAQWNGAWGTLTGGTMTSQVGGAVWKMRLSAGGTLFMGGIFNTAGGTTARFVAQWVGGAFGTLTGQTAGTIDNFVRAIELGLDGRLYIGGDFANGGGTAATRALQWNGAFGTLSTGFENDIYAIEAEPSGKVLYGGLFASAGGGSANAIAEWSGAGWAPLGSGLQNTGGAGSEVRAIFTDPQTGWSYVGGKFALAGALSVPDGAAQWNGYAWLPLDINFPGAGTIHAITKAASGTLYAGGTFTGLGTAASVAQVVNTGMTPAYPIFRARNTGGGNVRLYQFVNTATGDGVYFNLSLLPGEEAILDLTPTRRTFTSSFRGNIFSAIVAGSNLATTRLMPGTNYISFFADSDNLATSLYWRPRHDSADGGTVY